LISFFLALITLGISWLVYPCFAFNIVKEGYEERGWSVQIELQKVKKYNLDFVCGFAFIYLCLDLIFEAAYTGLFLPWYPLVVAANLFTLFGVIQGVMIITLYQATLTSNINEFDKFKKYFLFYGVIILAFNVLSLLLINIDSAPYGDYIAFFVQLILKISFLFISILFFRVSILSDKLIYKISIPLMSFAAICTLLYSAYHMILWIGRM
jgi:hypothetical protein